jgi:phosphoglycerol transferase MdoB-like AlkP superfamily enzyme
MALFLFLVNSDDAMFKCGLIFSHSMNTLEESLLEKLKKDFSGSYRIRIILGALFATVVADGIITKFLVSKGLAIEGNPLLGDWVNSDAFYIIKIFGALLALLYLWSIYRRHPMLSTAFSCLLLATYTFIVFWNLSILW